MIPAATSTFGSTFDRENVAAWWASNQLYIWSGSNWRTLDTKIDGAWWDRSSAAWTAMAWDENAHVASHANVVWTDTAALVSGGNNVCPSRCAPLANGPGAIYRP
jgi:hypothetical protein